MEFYIDDAGSLVYNPKTLASDLQLVYTRVPGATLRQFGADEYFVLPPSTPSGIVGKAKFLDAEFFKRRGKHYFANFLPDGERPADVPAL